MYDTVIYALKIHLMRCLNATELLKAASYNVKYMQKYTRR